MVNIIIEPYEPLIYKAVQRIEELEPQFFNGIDKIILEQGDPGHFGKVQSDTPNTIFVSIQKIKSLMSSGSEDDVIDKIAEVLAHEVGHIRDELKSGEAPAEKEQQLMRDRLVQRRMRAAYFSKKLEKRGAIRPHSTPTELADSILRIIYHFAQKVNPENQQDYLRKVVDRMRSVNPTEVASRKKNPGGGIGATISITKNILAGQPIDVVYATLALVYQRATEL